MDLEEEYDPSFNDDEEENITQEDVWSVISADFEEKGLVRHQLDSFDEFIQNTMQEIVDESADIEIRPESQHNPGQLSDFAEATLGLAMDILLCEKNGWVELQQGVGRLINAIVAVLGPELAPGSILYLRG